MEPRWETGRRTDPAGRSDTQTILRRQRGVQRGTGVESKVEWFALWLRWQRDPQPGDEQDSRRATHTHDLKEKIRT